MGERDDEAQQPGAGASHASRRWELPSFFEAEIGPAAPLVPYRKAGAGPL